MIYDEDGLVGAAAGRIDLTKTGPGLVLKTALARGWEVEVTATP